MAIIVDQGKEVRGFLVSLKHLRKVAPKGYWAMTELAVLRYKNDRRIESFELESRDGNWSATSGSAGAP
jgi:hypothetical protein